MPAPDDEQKKPETPIELIWETPKVRPILHASAFHGLAGEISQAIKPETEADVAGLLFEILAAFGNAVGRAPYVSVGAVHQAANLFVAKIGETAKGRKGQGWAEVRRIFRRADEQWAHAAITSGLSSGEGLIASLSEYTDKKGNVTTPDKRALVIEPEMGKVLRVIGREKNTLVDVVRDAWDGEILRVKTRKDPLEAPDTHVTIIAHCTLEEVNKELDDLLVANGFANRFLFCCAFRSRKLAFGGNLTENTIQDLADKLSEALNVARNIQEVTWSEPARATWKQLYEGTGFRETTGLTGAIAARGEAQTVRLCLIFALLDGCRKISLAHLRAAYACWQYAEDSARYVFGNRLGDPVEERLLDAARDAYPRGIDGTEQNRAAGGKGVPKARKALIARGLLREERILSGVAGHPTTFVFATLPADQSDQSDLSPLLDDPRLFPGINPINPINPQGERENVSDEDAADPVACAFPIGATGSRCLRCGVAWGKHR